MSSNSAFAALSKADVKLIREVLRDSGLRGVDSLASSDMKLDASIFLVGELRRGARTKGALSEALNRRRPWNGKAISRWKGEGGR